MIPGSKTFPGVNPHTGWLPESSILDSHGGRTINDCPRFAERKCSRQLTCQFSTDWIPSSRILIFALSADWLRKFSKIFSLHRRRFLCKENPECWLSWTFLQSFHTKRCFFKRIPAPHFFQLCSYKAAYVKISFMFIGILLNQWELFLTPST